jgi:hypothetical protein
VTNQLNQLCKELELVKARSPVNQGEIRAITDPMDELLYREEMLWLHRSRISWLREGGHNTRFFHMKAKCRAKKNSTWCDTLNEMKGMVRDFLVIFLRLTQKCVLTRS